MYTLNWWIVQKLAWRTIEDAKGACDLADALESTHPTYSSYDDTAGCTQTQDHQDRQKSRLSAYATG